MKMEDYEKLLEKAMKSVPKTSDNSERFKVPEIKAFLMGARTIIDNFADIAGALRRDPSHLQKFLLKELATKGELSGNRLIVQGKFGRGMIQKKIDLYMKNYVYCPECKKPDTKLVKEDRFVFIKCEACGSRHVVKKI